MAASHTLLDIKPHLFFFVDAIICGVTIMPPNIVTLPWFSRVDLLSSWPGLHKPAQFKEIGWTTNQYLLDIK
jgi:hypothetical protein